MRHRVPEYQRLAVPALVRIHDDVDRTLDHGCVLSGPEIVTVGEGLFNYKDACSGTPNAEVFYGSLTEEGWFVPPIPGGPPTMTFTDRSSMLLSRSIDR